MTNPGPLKVAKENGDPVTAVSEPSVWLIWKVEIVAALPETTYRKRP
jgi:hypothetical protein